MSPVATSGEIIIRKMDDGEFKVSIEVGGKEKYWVVNRERLEGLLTGLQEKFGPMECDIPQ